MNPPRSDEFRLDNLDAAAGLNEEKETLLQEADDAHEAAMELSRTPLAAVAALKAVAVDAMASELAEADLGYQGFIPSSTSVSPRTGHLRSVAAELEVEAQRLGCCRFCCQCGSEGCACEQLWCAPPHSCWR